MPYFSTVSSSLAQPLVVTALQNGFLLEDASRVNELLSLMRYIELTSLYGFLVRVSLFFRHIAAHLKFRDRFDRVDGDGDLSVVGPNVDRNDRHC